MRLLDRFLFIKIIQESAFGQKLNFDIFTARSVVSEIAREREIEGSKATSF